jgi:hypothetical protein
LRVHLDVLGWLYILVGTFGGLTGASLVILSIGTTYALGELGSTSSSATPTVWLLASAGIAFSAVGAAMVLVGRDLARRGRFGLPGALVLAALNLFLVPFGTALSVYAFWALLNDEARREFGRPLRGTAA